MVWLGETASNPRALTAAGTLSAKSSMSIPASHGEAPGWSTSR